MLGKTKYLSLLTLLLCCVLLISCAETDGFYIGEGVEVDKDGIVEDNQENDASDKAPPTDEGGETVYWTDSGSVWHMDKNCSYLAGADKVNQGSISSSGKSKECSRCLNTENGEITKPTESDTDKGPTETGEVFWTDSGSVYHLDRECFHIRNSENVKSGTLDEATSLGKEHPCQRCGNNTGK